MAPLQPAQPAQPAQPPAQQQQQQQQHGMYGMQGRAVAPASAREAMEALQSNAAAKLRAKEEEAARQKRLALEARQAAEAKELAFAKAKQAMEHEQAALTMSAQNLTKLLERKTAVSAPLFHGVLNITKPDDKDYDGNVYMRLDYDVFRMLANERTSCIARLKSKKEERMRARLEELDRQPAKRTGGGDGHSERYSLLCQIKRMKFVDMQQRLRRRLEEEQKAIMGMPDKKYKKFLKWGERQITGMKRMLARTQTAAALALVKDAQETQRRMLSRSYAERDKRIQRNKAVVRFHERLSREVSKKRVDNQKRRLEAVKANKADDYLEMLARDGAAGERYEQIEAFLRETEGYLEKLGGKIATIKMQQASSEAATAAAADALEKGYSAEEIEKIKADAGASVDPDEVLGTERSGYYNVAHSKQEIVTSQPECLRGGTLREYQVVGLQWTVSLYNNGLNGVLADEMGLGKTVQVIALIGYLMEMKRVTGPHLIIVPNAVVGNWMYEFNRWLPQLKTLSYTGEKKSRHELFQREVATQMMNVVVTTYEYAMRDRAKLSSVHWKYIVIDEAQRLKSRNSQLSKDLDRYESQRRLLLTGTPLQNDLGELWSLLNMLLPNVFECQKTFEDWFTNALDRQNGGDEEDWLEKEKRVIIIGRLHQILEPFMLRRQVEDVEGKLPPKVAHVIKCPMSMYQNFIYDWVRHTGTVRKDPYTMMMEANKSSVARREKYKPLANRVMELKKVSNHPHLTYDEHVDGDIEMRRCGKLWLLDRMLVKLKLSGHRVLLFSTMKRCLDIIERYLQWRQLDDGSRMKFCRIDGSTPLDERNEYIQEFNRPGSDTFIFLISIRAGGRGINLQTADTVVMYDPDYNPKNEEQAIARAHRIGQTKEVRVFHLESVAETPFEDRFLKRGGGDEDEGFNATPPDEPAPEDEDHIFSDFPEDGWKDDSFLNRKRKYSEAIEGLIRSNIQGTKIKMADEIINAGAFDGQKTDAEKKANLEKLLLTKKTSVEHGVRSMREINRLMARSKEEVQLFDKLDKEYSWYDDPCTLSEVPDWLRFSAKEAMDVTLSQNKKDADQGTALVTDLTTGRAIRRLGRQSQLDLASQDQPVETAVEHLSVAEECTREEAPPGASARPAGGLVGVSGEAERATLERRPSTRDMEVDDEEGGHGNEEEEDDDDDDDADEDDEDDIQDLSEDVDDYDGAGEDDGGDDATDAIAAAPAGLRKVRFIQRPQQ